VLEEPDRLRTEIMTGFGQLLLQLTSDGEVLSAFSHTTVPGRFFRGSASAKNLALFTRIPLPAIDMVRLQLYDPPLIDFQRSEVQLEDLYVLLRLAKSDLQQELLFDEQLQLNGCRHSSAGRFCWESFIRSWTKSSDFRTLSAYI